MNNKLLSVIVFLLLITVTISAREDINPFKDLEEGAILSGEAEFGDKFGLPMEDAVLNGFGMLGDEKSFTIFFNKEGEYLKLKIDGQWVTYGGFKERTSEEYTPEGPFLEFYTGETKIKAANFTTAEDWTYRVGSHDLSLKSGSKVRIKDDQLTEGTQLTLSKASVLTIRNHELNLPEGTKVKIEKNRVIICAIFKYYFFSSLKLFRSLYFLSFRRLNNNPVFFYFYFCSFRKIKFMVSY
jgi:hypothetical protein